MAISDTLRDAGISAFGLTMPVLSPRWTDGTTPTADDAAMSLALGAGNWLAPIGGTLRKVEDTARLRVTLVRPGGGALTGVGMLLTVNPQAHLRLCRLYARLLETADTSRPERERGLPVRPVPRFFFFADAVGAADRSGEIGPSESVGHAGTLTVYDSAGMPLDPIAVGAAFLGLMGRHHLLQKVATGATFDANPPLQTMVDSLAGTSAVRIRLSDHGGQPYGGGHLTGITALSPGSGLFTLDPAGGGGSGTIGKEASTGTGGGFPDAEARLLLVGPATTGRLGAQCTPPGLPAGVSLARDFFAVWVVQLRPYLLGSANAGFPVAAAERPPPIRLNEPLNLLTDGNDVLGAASDALSGAPTESLCVAQAVDATFAVPAQIGPNAHWSAFPPPPAGTTAASAGNLELNLRNGFSPNAQFLDRGDGSAAIDVVLTLAGLPPGAAVRVYTRKWVEDAQEARGDGAGGVVGNSGTLTLVLKDPLALRQPGVPESAISIPANATLRVDVMIVKATGEARLYGNVTASLSSTTTTIPPSLGTNGFNGANLRGISRSGVLGLGVPLGAPLPTDVLQAILALTGEGTPRDAPRLPSMARRDLLVAGLSGGNWKALLASGRLAPEMHSAGQRLGAPGSPGGRETQAVGVSTQNGRLAYDIARMAFRRAKNFAERIVALAADHWDEPAEPVELLAGGGPTASSGTFVGAVLQTISRLCETPEAAVLRFLIDPTLAPGGTPLPNTFNDLVDWVAANLVPAGIPRRADIVNALNGLKSNPKATRLFDELQRELLASCYGRRDAQWALQGAIGKARRFIYVETAGFAATEKVYVGTPPAHPYSANLLQALGDRIGAAPGLHVIICTPKYPDFASGFEPLAAYEAHDRRAVIRALPTADDPDPNVARVVAFHPIGFPGRRSRLESTVVIVDDVWALVGSSTWRRRGLAFDGGSDLVFTDTALENGRSPAITEFRRRLMATRMGVDPTETDSFGNALPTATFVRLGDGVEAFYAIREMLVAGGLGKIDRLWNEKTPFVTPIDPASVSVDLANPDGEEFDLASALASTLFAGLNAF